jgi:hypothetical protein
VYALWRHVVRRPHERVRGRSLGAEEPAETEVTQLDHARTGYEHVCRLDVYNEQIKIEYSGQKKTIL